MSAHPPHSSEVRDWSPVSELSVNNLLVLPVLTPSSPKHACSNVSWLLLIVPRCACEIYKLWQYKSKIHCNWDIVQNVNTEHNDLRICFNMYTIEQTAETSYLIIKVMNIIVFILFLYFFFFFCFLSFWIWCLQAGIHATKHWESWGKLQNTFCEQYLETGKWHDWALKEHPRRAQLGNSARCPTSALKPTAPISFFSSLWSMLDQWPTTILL